MRPKIYLFGDSITEYSFNDGGWGAYLTNHFCRNADVVLRGYRGYNTRWALKVMKKVFPPPENTDAPLAVTVFFGANDASLPERGHGFLHVPLDEYSQNLRTIISFLKMQWPSTHVLLITPPPVYENDRLLYPYTDNPSELPDRTNEATGGYAKQCLAVAAECGVPAIDLWGKMQELPGWHKAYLSDGLHLTPRGNEVVFKEVIEQLRQAQICPETLPAHLPLLEDINQNDPLKSFEN